MTALFCFGAGYSARALAARLEVRDWPVRGTSRTEAGVEEAQAAGFQALLFDGERRGAGIAGALRESTHVVVSASPDTEGDPVLRWHGEDLSSVASLRWVGYLSTIGVYGNTEGAWVDEDSPAEPTSERALRRLAAERAWLEFGRRAGIRVQIFRLGGIYGPGRSAIDDLRDGTARRIVKPAQVFNRIHVADIAGALYQAMAGKGAYSIYNVVDDEPAPSQDVVTYAAELLGIPPPPEVFFEQSNLSPMARSFYSANRRVRNTRLKTDLGVSLIYPTYREGLRSLVR